MTVRLLTAIVLLGAAMVLTVAACGEADLLEPPTSAISSLAPAQTNPTSPDTTVGEESPNPPVSTMTDIIVELAVQWRPEPDLESEEAVTLQRAAIAEAQKQVIELLRGTEFQVIEAYEFTPQMALAVDGEGLDRLGSSDLISNVSEDIPEAPTG